jgi:5'-nucleotidase
LGSLAQDAELVIAGVNEGANVGDDVFISGTVGAALHGYLRGLSALAISVTALHSIHYRPTAHIAAHLVAAFADGSLPQHTLLNVNVPDLPAHEIKGVVLARRAHRRYDDLIQEAKDDRGKTFYWIVRQRPLGEVEDGTDIWAIRNGNVSIVSLQSDMISSKDSPQLQALRDTLWNELHHREVSHG